MHDAQHKEYRCMYYHNLYCLVGTTRHRKREEKGGDRRILYYKLILVYVLACYINCHFTKQKAGIVKSTTILT